MAPPTLSTIRFQRANPCSFTATRASRGRPPLRPRTLLNTGGTKRRLPSVCCGTSDPWCARTRVLSASSTRSQPICHQRPRRPSGATRPTRPRPHVKQPRTTSASLRRLVPALSIPRKPSSWRQGTGSRRSAPAPNSNPESENP